MPSAKCQVQNVSVLNYRISKIPSVIFKFVTVKFFVRMTTSNMWSNDVWRTLAKHTLNPQDLESLLSASSHDNFQKHAPRMYTYCLQGDTKKVLDLIHWSEEINSSALKNYPCMHVVLNWNKGLEGACEGGHVELTELIFKHPHSRLDINQGLYGACNAGNFEMVEFMIAKKAFDWNGGFDRACRGGHIRIAKLMIIKGGEAGAFFWEDAFEQACKYNYLELIRLIVSKEKANWNRGLIGACAGGHFELVQYIRQNGGTYCYNVCDYDFSRACQGGNLKLIKLLTQNEPNVNWEYGLVGACTGGHYELANYIIGIGQCGGYSLDWPFVCACEGGYVELVNLLMHHGANNWNGGIHQAYKNDHFTVIYLILSKGGKLAQSAFEIQLLSYLKICYPDNKKELYCLFEAGINQVQLQNIPGISNFIADLKYNYNNALRQLYCLPFDLWGLVRNYIV